MQSPCCTYFQYRMYSVRQNVLAKPLRFRLCDTRGLEESQGIDSMEISYILDGHVPDGYNVSFTALWYEKLL